MDAIDSDVWTLCGEYSVERQVRDKQPTQGLMLLRDRPWFVVNSRQRTMLDELVREDRLK